MRYRALSLATKKITFFVGSLMKQNICDRLYPSFSFQILASHGANLGQIDRQGDSALYWAARQGHSQIIK